MYNKVLLSSLILIVCFLVLIKTASAYSLEDLVSYLQNLLFPSQGGVVTGGISGKTCAQKCQEAGCSNPACRYGQCMAYDDKRFPEGASDCATGYWCCCGTCAGATTIPQIKCCNQYGDPCVSCTTPGCSQANCGWTTTTIIPTCDPNCGSPGPCKCGWSGQCGTGSYCCHNPAINIINTCYTTKSYCQSHCVGATTTSTTTKPSTTTTTPGYWYCCMGGTQNGKCVTGSDCIYGGGTKGRTCSGPSDTSCVGVTTTTTTIPTGCKCGFWNKCENCNPAINDKGCWGIDDCKTCHCGDLTSFHYNLCSSGCGIYGKAGSWCSWPDDSACKGVTTTTTPGFVCTDPSKPNGKPIGSSCSYSSECCWGECQMSYKGSNMCCKPKGHSPETNPANAHPGYTGAASCCSGKLDSDGNCAAPTITTTTAPPKNCMQECINKGYRIGMCVNSCGYNCLCLGQGWDSCASPSLYCCCLDGGGTTITTSSITTIPTTSTTTPSKEDCKLKGTFKECRNLLGVPPWYSFEGYYDCVSGHGTRDSCDPGYCTVKHVTKSELCTGGSCDKSTGICIPGCVGEGGPCAVGVFCCPNLQCDTGYGWKCGRPIGSSCDSNSYCVYSACVDGKCCKPDGWVCRSDSECCAGKTCQNMVLGKGTCGSGTPAPGTCAEVCRVRYSTVGLCRNPSILPCAPYVEKDVGETVDCISYFPGGRCCCFSPFQYGVSPSANPTDLYTIHLQLQTETEPKRSLWIVYNTQGTNPLDSIVEISGNPTSMDITPQRPGKIRVYAITFDPNVAIYKELLDVK